MEEMMRMMMGMNQMMKIIDKKCQINTIKNYQMKKTINNNSKNQQLVMLKYIK